MSLSWNGITGQSHVKEILTKIINSKRIPHALLFSGPDGVGKYNVALRFSQLINLHEDRDNNQLLRKIETLQEPYIKLITPLPRGKNESSESSGTEKLSREVIDLIQEELRKKIINPYYRISIPEANNIKISSIREIKKFLSFQFTDVKNRVIIILDAHLMSDDAQNALLKSLEEPPEGVIFILITPYKDMLFETVRSRCWLLNFEPLNNDEISEILTGKFGVNETEAKKLAPFALGSITQGLEILENDFEFLLEKTIKILRFSLALKYHSAMLELQPVLSDDSGKKFLLLLRMVMVWLSDTQREKNNFNEYFFSDYLETIERFNLRFNPDISTVLNSIEKLYSAYDANVNLNVLAMNLIYEIASLRLFNYKK